MTVKKNASKPVWFPVDYTTRVVRALQALAAGKATDTQQRLAIDWIVNKAASTYDWPFRPDSARDTDIALGRQFVGQQIVKLINLDPKILRKAEGDDHNTREHG